MIALRLASRVETKLKLAVRLTAEIRLMVMNNLISLKLALIEEVRGERYEPTAQCPNCETKLNAAQIHKGFRQDPRDFTTQCPSCRTRFAPTLIAKGRISSARLPYYCPTQVLDQMRNLSALDPNRMKKEHPAVYYSALVHYGSLRNAFAKLGIEYESEEIPAWKEKAQEYLGLLPDTVIATVVEVPVRVVRAFRRELGISRFRLRDLADSLA